MATPLPPHMLEADPGTDAIPRYPAPVDLAAQPPQLQNNVIVKLYLELAPQYEAEWAELAASDAGDDDAVAAALVASTK